MAETAAAWQTELARGLFIVAGAAIAFIGVWMSQRQQARRDRENDARALRDAQRQRFETGFIPIIVSARAMWELALRQGRRPEEVSLPEERDYLERLWERAGVDVEEPLVRLTLEADPNAAQARTLFEYVRSEFFAYLGYRSEGDGLQTPASLEKIMASREAIYSNLQDLELLAQSQLARLSLPLPSRHGSGINAPDVSVTPTLPPTPSSPTLP